MATRTLALSALVIDPEVNIRAGLDEATVAHYAEVFAELPPPVAFETENGGPVVGDGFHRIAAARRNGLAEIEVDVRAGGREAALEHAATANTKHGLPLTPTDRMRAAERLAGLGWAGPKIAAALGFTPSAAGQAVRAARVAAHLGDNLVVAEENRAGRHPKPGQALTPSHLREIAAAPEADWKPLAETASARGWSREETAMAARTLRDPEVPEEQKAAIRSGESPPLAKDDNGQWTVSRDTLGRVVREAKEAAVVSPLLKVTHAAAVLAVAMDRNGTSELETLTRKDAETHIGSAQYAIETLEMAIAAMRKRPVLREVDNG